MNETDKSLISLMREKKKKKRDRRSKLTILGMRQVTSLQRQY